MADYQSAYTGQEIDAGIAKANTSLETSKVKNANSTTAGDVYDVRYINSMIGDVETILTTLTTGSGV